MLTSSPTSVFSGGAGGSSRTLDSSPPMPPRQRRSPSVLFTPPMDDGMGMAELGADPMVRDMAAAASVDKAFQTLAANHPEAVDALAQLQQAFRQLISGVLAMQQESMGGMGGAPNIVPPLPMQSGATSGMQGGPGI